MHHFFIQRMGPTEKLIPPEPGVHTTIALPESPTTMASWQDFISWLMAHPEIIASILSAILLLFGAASTNAKAAQNVPPPA